MALYEIQVVRRDGAIETRYSDRPVRVGDPVRIDTRTLVVVERLRSPSDPLATAAFLCAEDPAHAQEPSRRRSHPAARRAA